ncbi:unnamed protein product [Calicophoron daubneyi]|uniref:Uncharacterized protein n=1 Tax=Calicophoron daubneyi TaxID=300641 RepID=A0AAV2SYG7_CALDB
MGYWGRPDKDDDDDDDDNDDNSKKLSTGAIAGIVIACCLVAIIIIVIIVICLRRRRRQSAVPEPCQPAPAIVVLPNESGKGSREPTLMPPPYSEFPPSSYDGENPPSYPLKRPYPSGQGGMPQPEYWAE